MRTDTKPSRVAFGLNRWAAFAIAAALAAPLPGCGLDRRPIGSTYHFYGGRAIVRTAAGVEVIVVSDSDPLFADDMFVLAGGWTLDASLTSTLQSRYKRALQRRLTALAADPAARARFGDGACLVAEPQIEWIRGGSDSLPPEETGPEMPLCTDPAPPPACETGGGTPVLAVDPPMLAFGPVPLGIEPPPTQIVNITNEGDGFLCLASIVHAGAHAREYEVDDSNCRPTDPDMARRFLGPGASCTVRVTFRPSDPGPFDASLRVSSNVSPVLREFPMTAEGQPGTLGPRTEVCIPRGSDGCYDGPYTLTVTGPGAVRYGGVSFPNYGAPWEGTCDIPAGVTGPWQLLPPGTTLNCREHVCVEPPPPASMIVQTTGILEDPANRSFEIPIVGRATCP